MMKPILRCFALLLQDWIVHDASEEGPSFPLTPFPPLIPHPDPFNPLHRTPTRSSSSEARPVECSVRWRGS